ncbi:type I restriction-modification enzyme R subunit C-terminal domain-containing protein [Pelagicoccus sp. SDUM812002]|nr:type I restriction-modification enzyme R subunit C-terminal domain-containing protein [Pelagicoccus sp. SDUM812002]MDQ8186688.1 type I restriction-modification enzyme R subunit C-terminal domain-containing protein [Pelagicoccus sp. SDUM812002]
MQTIDHDTLDRVLRAEWNTEARERSSAYILDFETFCQQHRDQLDALTIYYQQPHRRQEVTLAQIKDVLAVLKSEAPRLAPLRVWEAYARLDSLPENARPLTELTALIALIRRASGLDQTLTPFTDTVRRNFRDWILRKNAGQPLTDAQTDFVQMIRDHIVTSFRFERDDLDYAPFDAQGGLGKMYQLFGDNIDPLIEELNKDLTA